MGLFKKATNYKKMERSENWIVRRSDDMIGRSEKRRNFFSWLRKNHNAKMKRNERMQKKAARMARRNRYKQDKED